MVEISHHPPAHIEHHIDAERVAMKKEMSQSIEDMMDIVPRDQHCKASVGYGENKEIIVVKCFEQATMKQCKERPLEATRGTLRAREQLPGTNEGEWGRNGIDTIVPQRRQSHNERQHVGHNPVYPLHQFNAAPIKPSTKTQTK